MDSITQTVKPSNILIASLALSLPGIARIRESYGRAVANLVAGNNNEGLGDECSGFPANITDQIIAANAAYLAGKQAKSFPNGKKKTAS